MRGARQLVHEHARDDRVGGAVADVGAVAHLVRGARRGELRHRDHLRRRVDRGHRAEARPQAEELLRERARAAAQLQHGGRRRAGGGRRLRRVGDERGELLAHVAPAVGDHVDAPGGEARERGVEAAAHADVAPHVHARVVGGAARAQVYGPTSGAKAAARARSRRRGRAARPWAIFVWRTCHLRGGGKIGGGRRARGRLFFHPPRTTHTPAHARGPRVARGGGRRLRRRPGRRAGGPRADVPRRAARRAARIPHPRVVGHQPRLRRAGRALEPRRARPRRAGRRPAAAPRGDLGNVLARGGCVDARIRVPDARVADVVGRGVSSTPAPTTWGTAGPPSRGAPGARARASRAHPSHGARHLRPPVRRRDRGGGGEGPAGARARPTGRRRAKTFMGRRRHTRAHRACPTAAPSRRCAPCGAVPRRGPRLPAAPAAPPPPTPPPGYLLPAAPRRAARPSRARLPPARRRPRVVRAAAPSRRRRRAARRRGAPRRRGRRRVRATPHVCARAAAPRLVPRVHAPAARPECAPAAAPAAARATAEPSPSADALRRRHQNEARPAALSFSSLSAPPPRRRRRRRAARGRRGRHVDEVAPDDSAPR